MDSKTNEQDEEVLQGSVEDCRIQPSFLASAPDSYTIFPYENKMQTGDRDSFYTVMTLSKVRGNQSEGELMALKDRDMYKWHIICISDTRESSPVVPQSVKGEKEVP